MDKVKLTETKLGRVFNSRCGCACLCPAVVFITKTAKLKEENSTSTTFGFSPISFHVRIKTAASKLAHSSLPPLSDILEARNLP